MKLNTNLQNDYIDKTNKYTTQNSESPWYISPVFLNNQITSKHTLSNNGIALLPPRSTNMMLAELQAHT